MKKNKKRAALVDPRERLQLLLENTKEYAIIVLDTNGRVEDWNKGAKHLLGYTDKEIVGKNFARFFTPKDRRNHRPEIELKTAQQLGHADDENWLVRKNNQWFWASGLTIAISDKIGNLVGFAKIIRDLTDKQEIEQQKDDFISIVSHELRTPLTIATLHKEVLERYLHGKKDKEGLKYLHHIGTSLQNLDHLIRDLLNVSKIQSSTGDINKEMFSLTPVIRALVQEIKGTTSHAIIVKGNTKRKIYGYKQQISEVMTNLLTNAIKYSSLDKKIIVTVKERKTHVLVSVQDFGIGINKNSIHRIFDRFYRTDKALEKKIPGLGLGLYIAKKIVENHGGKIHVVSKRTEGTTFSFTLPFTTE